MPAISKPVRDAIRDRLADPVQGFNARHAAAAGAAGVPAISIDWEATSKQFFQGYLSPEQIEETTAFRYPAFVLYTARAANQNRAKHHNFSGLVDAYLDVHLSQTAGKALPDFETALDTLEDVLFALFSSCEWTAAYTKPLCFSGQIETQRLPVAMDGRNWRQTLRLRMIFNVDQLDD